MNNIIGEKYFWSGVVITATIIGITIFSNCDKLNFFPEKPQPEVSTTESEERDKLEQLTVIPSEAEKTEISQPQPRLETEYNPRPEESGEPEIIQTEPETPEEIKPENPEIISPEESIKCEELSENECFDSEKCRGVYGPSSCRGNTCTTDHKFQACIEIPEERIQQGKIDKVLCENTQGNWHRDFSLEPGICNCPQYNQTDTLNPNLYHEFGKTKFVKEKGCVSEKNVCEENGGTWKMPEASSTEIRKDILHDDCANSSIYILKYWDKENSACIFIKFDNPNPKCLINGKEIVDSFSLLNTIH